MKRRRLLIGSAVATATALTVGAGVLQWTPGWRQGQFSTPARELLAAVAASVLKGLWPSDRTAVEMALQGHLQRLAAVVAGLPPHSQSELSDLLALLCLPPVRWALAGLARPWAQASVADVDAALLSMRSASLPPRIQAYQALRELTVAAHFSAPQSWAVLGYPGPRPL